MENFTKAAFSIENYFFDKVNIDLTKKLSKDLSLSFNTEGLFKGNDAIYELIFTLNVHSDKSKAPFITIQCRGIFKFHEAITFDSIPTFFYSNSIAILFPYVRAYVSMVTTQANIPGVILPTLNLSSLSQSLKENTTVQD